MIINYMHYYIKNNWKKCLPVCKKVVPLQSASTKKEGLDEGFDTEAESSLKVWGQHKRRRDGREASRGKEPTQG